MIRKQKDSVVWLEFELLADIPSLKHAVLLRHGGFSQGKYASLNLSMSVGDNPDHVNANLKKVKEILQIPTLVAARQVHGKAVQIASSEALHICDALTTSQRELALMIHHADCQAAIFYDPVHKALSGIHSGWRGSVANIYEETVRNMQGLYGSRPEDLLVGISPSLGPQNAEFIHYREELPESFWEHQVKPNYFDFWAITEMQLKACGIKSHHMEFARICTYGTPEDCYSYRRDKIRGGHGTLAMMEK